MPLTSDVKLRKEYTLDEIINITKLESGVFRGWQWGDVNLFVLEENEDNYFPSTPCYLDKVVFDDEHDNEGYSDFINENDLTIVCSAEQMQRVVDYALRQKLNCSFTEIMESLDHFLENDVFMDFDK